MTAVAMSAILSPCKNYRYELGRTWDMGRAPLVFIMFNPSTADEWVDDPTIRKCVGFARQFGYGGIRVVNLFAYRTSNPNVLRQHKADIVGPDNDRHIAEQSRLGPVVCAWGQNARFFPERVAAVMDLLPQGVFCLKQTSDGYPGHPLYIPYLTKLQAFTG